MTAHALRSHERLLRRWPTLGAPATIALALALFAGIFVLRERDGTLINADEILFVVPIALLALRFGLRGGLAAGLMGTTLIVVWDSLDGDATLGASGYVIRGVAFVLLGALLGNFVDQRRRLEAELSRHYGASIDLLATADLQTGHMTRTNPAWERLLGHTAETLHSRPLLEFVHPEDRDATAAEMASLGAGSGEAIGFRNRFRHVDGSYRWLQWNVTFSPSEGVIHAVGRDISAQREAELQLAINAKQLESKVAERTWELEEARAETLQRLAVAAEYRDDNTSEHTQRVGALAAEIALRIGLDEEQVTLLREAAPLHDVGKLAISDTILLKPGRLSEEEYEVMKTHAALGARLLSGSSSPVLQMAAVIAASHHERWDGRGYPAGLAGELIPLVGRVVAVADVFDALTHDRPYKSAWPVEEALAEMRNGAASQFDPRVLAAFLAAHAEAPGGRERHALPVPPHKTDGARRRRSSEASATDGDRRVRA
jgi:PAS domain S-box-containing protein